MKLKKMHWIGIIASAVILILDLVFFFKNERMLLFLVGIAFGVLSLPFVVGFVLENKRAQKVNVAFLEFTRNLAESVATGTPISRAIIGMRKNNYGELNPYVRKLANQIELGIPVNRALETFAADIDSPVVERATALIREAEKAGGEIDYILDSTAKSISEIEKLKEERKSAIYSLVVQGYIIFFVFVGIVLVMEFKIVPLTAGIGEIGGFSSGTVGSFQDLQNVGGGSQAEGISPEDFTRPFIFLLLTQGLFLGLVIGKLTEGNLKSGLKHSFILMISSFLISSGARLFIGGG